MATCCCCCSLLPVGLDDETDGVASAAAASGGASFGRLALGDDIASQILQVACAWLFWLAPDVQSAAWQASFLYKQKNTTGFLHGVEKERKKKFERPCETSLSIKSYQIIS